MMIQENHFPQKENARVTPEAFVHNLQNSVPTMQELEEIGLSLERARRLRNPCVCKPKTAQITYENPLLDLISRFDCSHVEIGMVTFGMGVLETNFSWQVGEVEADNLIVDKTSGEVFVQEYGSPAHVLWHCAKSGAQFWDALICANYQLAKGVYAPLEGRDQQKRHTTAEQCSEIAGGAEYHNFYLMLLGCE